MPPRAPDPAPSPALLVVAWPIAEPEDIARLTGRLNAIIATSDARVVVCDVGDLPPSCRAIEALARLALTARRLDRTIRLRRASPALQELLDFAGLAGVLPAANGR